MSAWWLLCITPAFGIGNYAGYRLGIWHAGRLFRQSIGRAYGWE